MAPINLLRFPLEAAGVVSEKLMVGCIFEAESARGTRISGDTLYGTLERKRDPHPFCLIAFLFPSSSECVRASHGDSDVRGC